MNLALHHGTVADDQRPIEQAPVLGEPSVQLFTDRRLLQRQATRQRLALRTAVAAASVLLATGVLWPSLQRLQNTVREPATTPASRFEPEAPTGGKHADRSARAFSAPVTALTEEQQSTEAPAAEKTSPTRGHDSERQSAAAPSAKRAEARGRYHSPKTAESEPDRPLGGGEAVTLLNRAYAAYRQGNPVGAKTLYDRILQRDPNNRRALYGRAAVAAQGGDGDRARTDYRRLVQLDPGDPLAAGALAALPGTAAAAAEDKLDQLVGKWPDHPHLWFLLGGVYAGQQRWTEARRAYGKAFRLAHGQAAGGVGAAPTYAFNLAVALEHLGQPAEAVAHYRWALAAGATRTAAFPRRIARNRLRRLKGEDGTP